MYEDMTFENILARAMARIKSRYDKREGSVIWNGISPSAAELAVFYIELDAMRDRAFVDTATGEDLVKKLRERGLDPEAATCAVRAGRFEQADGTPLDIGVGVRFSGGDVNYISTEQIEAGRYRMQCETAGAIGNEYFGTLFPITHVDKLAVAELEDILIPGEDDETEEHMRHRYYDSLLNQAFGGNVADYFAKTHAIQGVGGVKVYPVWNGGGTVKVVILDSTKRVPSAELVELVQTTLDPEPNQGKGLGLAPIGHWVTVEGAAGASIDISFTLTLEPGRTWEGVQEAVREAIQEYFDELAAEWEASEQLVVRLSQIETRVLGVAGVIDVEGTTLNDSTSNVQLTETEIPVLGEVHHATA